ncbi:MAG: serine/threonine protein kinase [Deltaproteobacteria bacterium]|nr:serine/threonine protein kinase [Deltaproteobacteria bacterium]
MRICCICGHRSSAFLCARDGTPTAVIEQHTDFPGRLLRGDQLLGRFMVDELIGVGGMGAVYRGVQLGTRKSVAIKVLWRDLAGDPIEIKRFGREARVAGMINHPNVVKVIDFGADTASNSLFIVMEFLVGQKLSDVMKRTPALPAARTVHIVAQTCKALAETHRKGVVHRDIKPDNIFLQDVAGKRDFVKLLDFGLSILAAPDPAEKPLTKPGYVVGSPEYIAPEQAAGDPVGPAADLYALGVVLYECLSGRLPFYGSSNQELLRKHIINVPPPLVAPVGAEPISEALQRVVMRCLEKDPSLRPANAEALEAELQRACDPSVPRSTGPAAVAVAVQAPGSVEAAVPADAAGAPHDTERISATRGREAAGRSVAPARAVTQVSPPNWLPVDGPAPKPVGLAASGLTGKLPSASFVAAQPHGEPTDAAQVARAGLATDVAEAWTGPIGRKLPADWPLWVWLGLAGAGLVAAAVAWIWR